MKPPCAGIFSTRSGSWADLCMFVPKCWSVLILICLIPAGLKQMRWHAIYLITPFMLVYFRLAKFANDIQRITQTSLLFDMVIRGSNNAANWWLVRDVTLSVQLLFVNTRCLQLLEVSWDLKLLLITLEISWNLVHGPGKFCH